MKIIIRLLIFRLNGKFTFNSNFKLDFKCFFVINYDWSKTTTVSIKTSTNLNVFEVCLIVLQGLDWAQEKFYLCYTMKKQYRYSSITRSVILQFHMLLRTGLSSIKGQERLLLLSTLFLYLFIFYGCLEMCKVLRKINKRQEQLENLWSQRDPNENSGRHICRDIFCGEFRS